MQTSGSRAQSLIPYLRVEAGRNPGGGSTVNDSGWLDLRRQRGTAVFGERLARAGMGYHLSRERLFQFQESAERTRAGPERFRLRSSAVAKQ